MRRLFKILLITLLAVRALVGDAMAYDMLRAAPSESVVAILKVASQEASSMPCHTVASEETGASPSACTTCQVCHLSAFLPAQFLAPAQPLLAAKPVSIAIAWRSADLALVSKPPLL
jgi:hypothetical protein